MQFTFGRYFDINNNYNASVFGIVYLHEYTLCSIMRWYLRLGIISLDSANGFKCIWILWIILVFSNYKIITCMLDIIIC